MSVKFDGGGRRKGKNPGFLAAIGLCFAAVFLVAAATAINNSSKKSEDDYMSGYISEDNGGAWLGIDENAENADVYIDEPTADTALSEDITEDVSAEPLTETEAAETLPEPEAEAVSAELPDVNTLELVDDEAVTVSAAVSYRMPISGDLLKGYSGDDLVYCSTMGDWRVHQGLDISGTPNCEVYAAADGVVVDFIEDVLFGYTAIIRHADESMLYYCGLTSEPMVTKGLEVHAGDVIGHLGVVPCEAEEAPHLHLAMMRDGSFVNPSAAMGF